MWPLFVRPLTGQKGEANNNNNTGTMTTALLLSNPYKATGTLLGIYQSFFFLRTNRAASFFNDKTTFSAIEEDI